jgi:hypothetical protein
MRYINWVLMMKREEALLAVAKLTTEDRNLTHGDPIAQFETAQQLKDELARGPHWIDLNAVEREAVEMICTKLSRMVHGKPSHSDHLLDIIGYAAIAVESRHQSMIDEDETGEIASLAHRLAPQRSTVT